MKFISPRTDFAFKKIFGSEESKDILISFLNAILELEGQQEIIDLTILDPYRISKIKILKDSCVDVRAKTQCGKEIIIEMQVEEQVEFKKRMMYNVAKSYVNQIDIAEGYEKLHPVIGIAITNFNVIQKNKKYINHFIFKRKRNKP